MSDIDWIDWSKAPEGATHWEYDNQYCAPGWLRHGDNGEWHYWGSQGKVWRHMSPPESDRLRFIVSMPIPWTGDGLPPVGGVCEVNDQRSGTWTKVDSILAHAHTAGRDVAVFQIGDYIAFSPADRFRPIRTPEQIAEEERKAAIEEMILLDEKGSLSRTYFCGLLYDAGYRKAGDA